MRGRHDGWKLVLTIITAALLAGAVRSQSVSPMQRGTIRFAVIGDFGFDSPNEAKVAALVKSWSPDFIVSVGDNNYAFGSAGTIDANVGKYYHDYIGDYQGRYGTGAATIRFFPVLGNHDWLTDKAAAYLDYFTLPGNERYYDYVEGAVHFFALDSDPHEPDGIRSTSTQAQWLQAGLAAAAEPWKIVYMHHTPYTSGITHGSQVILQWDYQGWGASAVMSGHEHLYERVMVDGFPYFVNGLGGSSIYPFGFPIPGSAVRFNGDFGAQLVTATDCTLTFEFITISSTVVDTYTLRRCDEATPEATP